MMRSWFSLFPCSFLCTALLLPSHARAPGAAGRPPDWTVQVNYPAVNLALQAPYNTVQLTARAHTWMGTPLPGASRPVFRASDSCVTVDATGLVTARAITKSRFFFTMFWKTTTYVVVAVTAEGVTLTDTAWIQVTPTPWPHAIKTFSMQPAPGDSAKWGRNVWHTGTSWRVLVTDVAGDTLCRRRDDGKCPLLIEYWPELRNERNYKQNNAANYNRHPFWFCGNLEWSGRTSEDRLRTDTVTLFATTLAYGVELKDSVVFRLGLPVSAYVAVQPQMRQGALRPTFTAVFRDTTVKTEPMIMGVGATLMFVSIAGSPYDVVFDHPEAVDTASCSFKDQRSNQGGYFDTTFHNVRPGDHWGSVAPTGRGNIPVIHHGCAARRFRKPGVYRFHSTMVPSDTVEVDVRAE